MDTILKAFFLNKFQFLAEWKVLVTYSALLWGQSSIISMISDKTAARIKSHRVYPSRLLLPSAADLTSPTGGSESEPPWLSCLDVHGGEGLYHPHPTPPQPCTALHCTAALRPQRPPITKLRSIVSVSYWHTRYYRRSTPPSFTGGDWSRTGRKTILDLQKRQQMFWTLKALYAFSKDLVFIQGSRWPQFLSLCSSGGQVHPSTLSLRCGVLELPGLLGRLVPVPLSGSHSGVHISGWGVWGHGTKVTQ